MSVDILAFGAHPDDAEIGCGGLLLKLKDRGYRTGIAYLTVGEMGSRGTPEVRRQELMAAAKVLGLDYVEVLDFQDCRLSDTFENRLKIAAIVRRQQPTIVLAPFSLTSGRSRSTTSPIAWRIFFTIYFPASRHRRSSWTSPIISING